MQTKVSQFSTYLDVVGKLWSDELKEPLENLLQIWDQVFAQVFGKHFQRVKDSVQTGHFLLLVLQKTKQVKKMF